MKSIVTTPVSTNNLVSSNNDFVSTNTNPISTRCARSTHNKRRLFRPLAVIISLLLTLNIGTVWGADVEVAKFESSSVVTSSSYATYQNDDWYLSIGGNNSSCGFNKNNKTTISDAHGTSATTTHHGYYIKSKNNLDNVYKITFVFTGSSSNGDGKLYLGYSTDNGNTWRDVSLKSGSGLSAQGVTANTNSTTYTFEFTAISSARYALVHSANKVLTTSSHLFRYDDVTATFYKEDAPATPYTVTFTKTDGSTQPITEESVGAGVTPPAMQETCGDWEFQGWSTTESDDDESTDELALVTLTTGKYYPTANTTLYPVYTKTGVGAPVETKTQTFQYDTWTKGGSSTDKNSYRLFHDGGYVESASNVDFSKLSKVIVYGGTFGGSSNNGISIRKADGTVWKDTTVLGSSQTGENTITDGASLTGTAKLRVYSTCGSNSGSGTGVRISKVEIYTMEGGSTTYYYSYPNCCTSWGDGDLNWTYSSNTLAVGGADLTATITGTTHGTRTFTSSNTNILTVNSDGKVHAVSPGTATVTVSWAGDATYCPKEMSKTFTVTGDCTIKFNKNGGSGTMSDQVVSYNTATNLTTNSFTAPAGKVFAGWNTEADGSGTRYEDGASITLTSNITLYAQWATSYTVTLIDNGVTWTETAYEGTPFELPDEHKSNCDDATFLGWATGEYTNHATGTSTNPGYTAPGETVNVTAATTFVAVYGELSAAVSTEYQLINSLSELVTADYLVVAHYSSSSKYAMSNTTSTSGYVNESSVTITNDKINNSNAALIWHVTKTGTNYTLYNANAGKYLALTTTQPAIQSEPHNFVAVFDGNNVIFESTTVTDYQLAYDFNFKSLTAQNLPIRLYKRVPSISSYTSHPHCCVAPTQELNIEADATTLIGSGVTHLTLTGGNNRAITWSTTGGTLSNKTNTGATLTLPAAGATTVYTVTATQPDDETDPNNVICGATVTINITVKAQWTITLNTKYLGEVSTYDTKTITDGETYTLPDLSEDYTCEEGYAFAGWATSQSATAVEQTAGSVITASATTTWWAVWQSFTSGSETVTKYEKILSTSDLVANATFVLSYNDKAMGSAIAGGWAAKVDVVQGSDGSYVAYPSSTTGVLVLTLKGSAGAWKFYSASSNKWLAMTADGNISLTDTEGDAATFTITLSGSDADIVNNAATKNPNLAYNTSYPRYKGYTLGNQLKSASLYKDKGNTVTISSSSGVSYFVNNEHCDNGAIIKAEGAWITAANGQKVKAVIPVVAKNFEAASTLAVANISDSRFTATLGETAVPAGPTGLETTLTVEYLPDASDVLNSTTITLSAGEATKTITINGRSLPDEFLMIAKKTLWYAVPANMNEGASQYSGVNVAPNDATEPTLVPVAPSTVVYSLKSVADSRYAANGDKVRLAGLGNKGLWVNNSAGGTGIYNNAVIGETNDAHYEWSLSTTDGIRYTITNPSHTDAASGRQLALGGSGGTQYGFYKSTTTFFIVPAGCTSQPQEVKVSARRTDATFSWISNASSLTIDIYTNLGMTEGHLSATVSSSPYMFLGLKEQTEYWFKLTPESDDACAVTGKFTTTGPVIDIVEWEEDKAIIFVDKDEELHPKIIIGGEVEHGQGSGATANELFFSKYFEGAGSMKLVAIFNGTTKDISLADYSLYTLNCSTPKKDEDIATSSFSGTTEYPIAALGTIKAGQEIIFFTRPSSADTPTGCSETFLNEKSALNGENQNPRWIECDNATYYGSEKFPAMQFNGNDAVCLEKKSSLIDIIGTTGDPGKIKNCANRLNDLGWAINVKNIDYGKASNDASFDELFEASTKSPSNDSERRTVLAGFGVNLDDEYIDLTTARCILFRDKTVTSGAAAVALNTGAEFATCQDYTYLGYNYKSEWNGRVVCMDDAMQTAAGVTNDGRATCNSYQDLGKFDYSQYYKEWEIINPGIDLDGKIEDPEAKLYGIDIPNLAQYSCLNLRFQLTDKDDATKIYTEQEVQVPILVKNSATTVDAIFNEIVRKDDETHAPLYDQSIERCKTCDVVVLGTGTLTKATDGTTHDVPEIGNLKVYPGGKLIVPSGTHFTANSLSLRRQEDDLAFAQILGDLTLKQENATYLDVRIDPSNWHYFTLPYDVNVSDVKFVDGTPAAIGTDYRIGRYDGEHRAATQSTSWVNLTSEDILKAGIGYIIGLPGSGKVQREVRFPMANTVITDEKQDKEVDNLHAWGGDKTDEELRPNHKGWNLIGAPYLTYYHTTLQEPLPTGMLIHDPAEDPWEGHWVRNSSALRYIAVPVDNGRSEYNQVDIANYHMAPFTSYFVQIGGADPSANQRIEYSASQGGKLSVVRRATDEYEDDNHEVWFGLELVNDKGESDKTTLLISDNFTDDYDMMDDFVKMRGTYYMYPQLTTKPILASRNIKGEMAFNALPDATAAAGVPLNFYAAQDGEYRFTISAMYALDEVKTAYLCDNENADKKWHNLLEEDYVFTTKRGDNTTRFSLVVTVERKQPEITTAVENISSKLTLTAINRTLIVSGLMADSDIFVYDVSGKLLDTERHSSSQGGIFRTTVENAGVYFVRVQSQSGQQTLQTIVY